MVRGSSSRPSAVKQKITTSCRWAQRRHNSATTRSCPPRWLRSSITTAMRRPRGGGSPGNAASSCASSETMAQPPDIQPGYGSAACGNRLLLRCLLRLPVQGHGLQLREPHRQGIGEIEEQTTGGQIERAAPDNCAGYTMAPVVAAASVRKAVVRHLRQATRPP